MSIIATAATKQATSHIKRVLTYIYKRKQGIEPTRKEKTSFTLFTIGTIWVLAQTFAIIFIIIIILSMFNTSPQNQCQKDTNINTTQPAGTTGRGGKTYDQYEAPTYEGPIYTPLQSMPAISSGFGVRVHPINGSRDFHTGIDLPKPTGTPAIAIADAIVVLSKEEAGYGNHIAIKFQNRGTITYAHYLHLSKRNVTPGTTVKAGDTIGLVGSTGNSTGPHLHFEIHLNKFGNYINPDTWLKQNNAKGVQKSITDPATGQETPLAPYSEAQNCPDSIPVCPGQTPATTGLPPGVKPATGTIPPPAPTGPNKTFLEKAFAKNGTPYVWGGTGPKGFDCSGLVYASCKEAGITIPNNVRTAESMRQKLTTPINPNQIQPGDLFYCMGNGGAYHVGIIAATNPLTIFEAPSPGKNVSARYGKPCYSGTTQYGRLPTPSTTGTPTLINNMSQVCNYDTKSSAPEDLKRLAQALMKDYGWPQSEWAPLDRIIQKESSWNYKAVNKSSGAKGLGQCLPSAHKCSAPPYQDYDTNAATQLKWAMNYIKNRYGTPTKALQHHQSHNWY